MLTPTIMVKLGLFAAVCFVASAVVFAFICEQILWPLLPSISAHKKGPKATKGGPNGGESLSSFGEASFSPPSSPIDSPQAADDWASFIAKKLTHTPEHVKKLEELERQRKLSEIAASSRNTMLGMGDYHRHGLLRQKGRPGPPAPGEEWQEDSPRLGGKDSAGMPPPGVAVQAASGTPSGTLQQGRQKALVVGQERTEKRKLGTKPALPVPKPRRTGGQQGEATGGGRRLAVDDFEVSVEPSLPPSLCSRSRPQPWALQLAGGRR